MPKISVLGGYTEEPKEDACPGNSSLTSTEQAEKTENLESSLTVQKTEKSYRKSRKGSTADSVEESTAKN